MSDTLHVFGTPNSSIVFTSCNTSIFPDPPILTDELYSIFHGLRARWAFDDYFYFAFVPVQPTYDGPLLGCLSSLSQRIEAVEGPGTKSYYHLDIDSRERWSALEETLDQVQRRFMRRLSLASLEACAVPSPSAFGYMDKWNSCKHGELALERSRIAFTLRLAFLSYLVLRYTVTLGDTWEELCRGTDPIPLTIYNAFQTSWVCDWAVPRIGAFVDITGTLHPTAGRRWHYNIPHIINLGSCIPLWFAYPGTLVVKELPSHILKICHRFRPHALEQLRPLLRDAINVVMKDDRATANDNRKHAEYYSYITVSGHVGSPPSTIDVRRRFGPSTRLSCRIIDNQAVYRFTGISIASHFDLLLEVLHFSNGQLRGETYEGFMHRHANKGKTLAMHEGSEERFQRARREEEQEQQPVPGYDGPRVFVWQREQGIEVRKPVRPWNVPYLWKRTSIDQRHYNSFLHEYDVNDLEQGPMCATTAVREVAVGSELVRPRRAAHMRERSASPSANLRRTMSPLISLLNPASHTFDHKYAASSQGPQPVQSSTLLLEPTASVVAAPPMRIQRTPDRHLSPSPYSISNLPSPTSSPHLSPPLRHFYSPNLEPDLRIPRVGEDVERPDSERETMAYKKIIYTAEEGGAAHSLHTIEENLAILVNERNCPDLTTKAHLSFLVHSANHMLAARYGFTPPSKPWTCITEKATQWLSDGNYASLHRSFGCRTRANYVGIGHINAVADFVALISDNIKPPVEICDLRRTTSFSSNISSMSVAMDGETRYMITSINGRKAFTETSWRLLVRHATSIMQAKREGLGPSKEDLLRYFIKRGIPANIMLPIPTCTVHDIRSTPSFIAPPTILNNRPVGLGVKPYNTAITINDYKAYAQVRDELLSGKAGRAALLRGGIVWRLACIAGNMNDAMIGPDIDDPSEWPDLRTTAIDGLAYAERTLSLQELYIISGVYRVLNRSTSKNASLESWWPLEEAWKESGLNVGYWSREAEEWFQDRLQAIKNGTGGLKTNHQWKKELRFGIKEVTPFLLYAEKMSAEVL